MAITFYDASDAVNASSILDILKENDVKCTFFLIGEPAEVNPESVNIIIQQGNEIGNHTYSHPYLTKLNPDEIKSVHLLFFQKL